MSDLRLAMHPLTFDELVVLGRAVIPSVAPAWTDHNVHDPGIMLMELMAWVSEAQMYSLSRLRRDERFAYARLLGEIPMGPRPAHGLVWPFASETGTPQAAPMWAEGTRIEEGRQVIADRADAPRFFTEGTAALTTARLVRLATFRGETALHDWTVSNARDGATFLPFGDDPRPGDRLMLSFELPGDAIGKVTGPLAIGVEIVNDGGAPAGTPSTKRRQLVATLIEGSTSRTVRIARDTTAGLLRSGVISVDLSEAAPEGAAFSIALASATGGFIRSPRVQRVAINVLSILQRESVDEPAELAGGDPHQSYDLQRRGLIFPFEPGRFSVRVAERGAFVDWREVTDLRRSGPDDRCYSVDRPNGRLNFGNGINGFVPPENAALSVTYQVCDGSRGNLPTNTRWRVAGVLGEFGINSEALSGGCNAIGLTELATRVRRRSRLARPLVTSGDLELAARSFTDFGVNRAKELPRGSKCRAVRGTRRLIVVSRHDPDALTPPTAEAVEFLDAVRARLVPRLPVGQRLEVLGPRYVPIRVKATLVAARKANPVAVHERAAKRLREKLRVTATGDGAEWPFERNVTRLAVAGWLRGVGDVLAVRDIRLLAGAGPDARTTAEVEINGRQLPQLLIEDGDITVVRQSLGGGR